MLDGGDGLDVDHESLDGQTDGEVATGTHKDRRTCTREAMV